MLEPHLEFFGSLSESSEPAHFRREGNSRGCAMLPYNARYIVFLIFLVMDELKSAHLFRLADFIFVSFLAMSFLYERCRSIVVQSSFNTPSNRLGVLMRHQAVNQYPSGKGAAPLDPASLLATLCSPWGLRPSQPAAAGCSFFNPMREHGGLKLAAMLPCMVELATIEPGVRADLATQGGSTFTFDWYALIARTRRWSSLHALLGRRRLGWYIG